MFWDSVPVRHFILSGKCVYYRVLSTKKETSINRRIIGHLVIDTHKVGTRIIGYVIKSKRRADIITGKEYAGIYYNRRIDLNVCYTSLYKNKDLEVYSDDKNFFIIERENGKNYTENGLF